MWISRFSTVVATATLWKSALLFDVGVFANVARVGVPRLPIAGPDLRCPSGEFRAAGALCFQNEYSEVVWYGLTRLYYKAFAETKPIL